MHWVINYIRRREMESMAGCYRPWRKSRRSLVSTSFEEPNEDTEDEDQTSTNDVNPSADDDSSMVYSAERNKRCLSSEPSNSQRNDTGEKEWNMNDKVTGFQTTDKTKGSETEEVDLSDIILDPEGKIVYYWMGIVTCAVIYNTAVIILRLAFPEMRDTTLRQSLFYGLDLGCDMIYVLDIIVHFRTSYYDDGCLVSDLEKLSQNYRSQTRFLLDVLAILPISSGSSVLSVICWLLCPPLHRVLSNEIYNVAVRIPRLLKYHTMAKFFQSTDSRTSNPNMVRAIKLSLYLWMVIHWTGCIYYIVSEYEGLGSNEWVYPSGPHDSVFTRKYIYCMYWSMMTLTTIGERPPPATDLEYVFTGMTFLIGVFVFAAVVGNVGDVISNMNASRQDFQARMDQIKFYMNHRGVPDVLQNRVKQWAEYAWVRTQAIDEPNVLQMLPPRLRTEIAIYVHLETLKKVTIFEKCEEGLLRELVLKLRSQIFSPGDYICRIGEIGREMYIINHGKVEILIPSSDNGKKTVVATLTAGNYFGEISLLKLDDGQNRRTADVRAVGYSELLCLSRKDLISALVEYPDAKNILEAQARERMEKTNEVRKISSNANPVISQEAPLKDERRKGKPKSLADVLQLDSFQKLLASKNTEMNDLQRLVKELKTFDSQASKLQMQQLSKQCVDLESELKQRNDELTCANEKIQHLETIIVESDSGANIYPYTDGLLRTTKPNSDSHDSDYSTSSSRNVLVTNSEMSETVVISYAKVNNHEVRCSDRGSPEDMVHTNFSDTQCSNESSGVEVVMSKSGKHCKEIGNEDEVQTSQSNHDTCTSNVLTILQCSNDKAQKIVIPDIHVDKVEDENELNGPFVRGSELDDSGDSSENKFLENLLCLDSNDFDECSDVSDAESGSDDEDS